MHLSQPTLLRKWKNVGVVGACKKAKENTGNVSGDKRGLKGGGSQVQGQPRLRSQLKASLGNFVRLCLK